MKNKLNITKEQWKYFLYFTLGLLILFESIFYKSGFYRILLISLKLSLLVHLSGYLIALRLFREEFDNIALLFLGLSFGLILTAFWYYVPTLFGVNLNDITYIVPIVLLLVGLGLHVGKEEEKKDEKTEVLPEKEEKANDNNNN